VTPYIGPGFIAALRNKAHSGRNKVVVGGFLVTHLSVIGGHQSDGSPQITSGPPDFAKLWTSRLWSS
jgi:hypothetical protein